MFGARFDDAVSRRSLLGVDPVAEIVADSTSMVRSSLQDAVTAVKDGYWVAGYVSYEAAPGFDPTLSVVDGTGGPLVWFGVFGDMVEVDPPSASLAAQGSFAVSKWTPDISAEEYEASFGAVRGFIEHGDTYQINLTFGLMASFSGDPDGLYSTLLAAQRPSYAAHLWHDKRHVLSVSPERFFAVSGRDIVTKPMKGTARRGRWIDEDEDLLAALEKSEKDRAENLMIVDLVRNDLGRICETGSVNVARLFEIEKYRTVWQMSSEVSGVLNEDADLAAVFGALFPSGSVTGAPKGASMEIISQLEKEPRGVYCGTVGFIPPGDGLDGASFNVAIRTAVIDTNEGMASYGVGGGITWDSRPEDELAEAFTKAKVLTEAPDDVGLFESIRWDSGYFMLEQHMQRLSQSATFWAIECDTAAVESVLEHLEPSLKGPSKVRLDLAESGEISVSVSRANSRFAIGPRPSESVVRLRIDHQALNSADARLFHKVTNRVHFDDRRKRNPNADDVLCINEHGDVTETTIANIAFKFGDAGDDTWVTPPREDGLLAGVLRDRLIEDGVLIEQSVSVAKARAAHSVAVINSVRGWLPATIDG